MVTALSVDSTMGRQMQSVDVWDLKEDLSPATLVRIFMATTYVAVEVCP